MRTFKDNKGDKWEIVVNVSTAKVVRDLTTVDLFNLYSGGDAATIFNDPALFVNVLYALCKQQCERRGVSDYDFGAALTGDSLEEASKALLYEIADFFPSNKRVILYKMIAAAETEAENQGRKALEALDKLTTTKPL